ncbi:tail protein X [Tatumella ptyseos]|uniref:Phage Tail Protein X n=2 Tax=Tatumella ptyseos TaxID=82987 RepID=A0A2X5PCK6_9GAMM|nr:tail protein X [Tatumella ptyseos]KFD18330.1 putative phage tail protein [Tatumella ptyseos ATCC 33301]SQK74502.1 Phage Tail Protein X [Tatumella ptyseos]
MPTTYLSRDGDMPDGICAAHYGAANPAFTLSQLLEANPGLAERGAVYPAGLVIVLPDITQPVSTGSLSLWD